MADENPYEFLGGAPEEPVSSTIGILIYAESENDKLNEESLIAVGKGRELADMLGSGVGAILLDSVSETLAQQLIYAGANKVFQAKDESFTKYDTELYCARLVELIEKQQPEIFISATSLTTVDFLPRVAQRLETGLVSGCISLELDTMERLLLATRPIYEGKMREVLVCEKARPQMVLLMPNTFPPPIMDDLRSGEIEKI